MLDLSATSTMRDTQKEEEKRCGEREEEEEEVHAKISSFVTKE